MVLKKIRLISWVTKAFLNKHAKLILSASLIGIIGFFLISKLLPYVPRPRKYERIARIGSYEIDHLPDDILKLLSLGLTTLAEDGSAVPGLAESWEITDQGKIYTFILKENLFWQDDSPVKAEEINYQFTDVEQEVVDERTIRFKLKEPFSPFLSILSKPIFKENFLGVGPYMIKRIQKNGNLVEKITLAGQEKDISFRFYPTEEAAILGFKLAEVDVLDNLLNNKLSEEWQKTISLETKIRKDQYLALFFNLENDFFKDKTIRQALAYAIKNEVEEGNRATGPISPLSWSYNPDVKLYRYDPSKARELLKQDDQEIELPTLRISTTEPFLNQAEEIKESWQEALNIETEIEVVNILSPDYQIFLGAQQTPSDPDQYVLWHSTRRENITHLKSPKIDKLLEDGRKIYNQEERKEKYWDFQKTLLEESPVVFLEHPQTYTITRKKTLGM